MLRLRLLALAAALAAGAPAAARAGAPWALPAARAFPEGASQEALDRPLSEAIAAFRARSGKRTFAKRIVVHKARRRMDVFADGELLKSYVVELGLSPVGDKEQQGDMRTPEGDLFVCAVHRASQFTRFLGLAYPTPKAAAAGVAAKRVPAAVERRVAAAFRKRDRCPPFETALGGLVGIHGGAVWELRPEGFRVVDWTWGCIAVRDADILELFEHYAEVGVPVSILAD